MCCLFGIMDYKATLTLSERQYLLTVLSKECEVRGKDATGIAYTNATGLHIFKKPQPAHNLRFRLTPDTLCIMGHTRMTTQGSEKHNRNNHPFAGHIGSSRFALAHNGMLYNDRLLRIQKELPATDIETDSYVAVQLLEQDKELTVESMIGMAEQVEGSFTFTVLDEGGNLSFIRGSNPMCIYHWPRGLYVYASTEEILQKALHQYYRNLGTPGKVTLESGDILQINCKGQRTYSRFQLHESWYPYSLDLWDYSYFTRKTAASKKRSTAEQAYIDDLKAISGAFGYTPADVESMLSDGITPEEIEECFYTMEENYLMKEV